LFWCAKFFLTIKKKDVQNAKYRLIVWYYTQIIPCPKLAIGWLSSLRFLFLDNFKQYGSVAKWLATLSLDYLFIFQLLGWQERFGLHSSWKKVWNYYISWKYNWVTGRTFCSIRFFLNQPFKYFLKITWSIFNEIHCPGGGGGRGGLIEIRLPLTSN
jgi:hypothetical protein